MTLATTPDAIIASKSATAPCSLVDVMQQSVYLLQSHDQNSTIAAMYIEKNDKAKCPNSFIISGLPEGLKSDNDLVEQLYQVEFGLSVDVQMSKHIGKSTSTRTQHLLTNIR